MRILVLSDSHNKNSLLEKALECQPKAKTVFFLGDGADSMQDISKFFPDRKFYIVAGNCDFSSKFPKTEFADINGIKIMATHGDIYRVKSGLDTLCCAAERENAKIVLYGHTHNADILYKNETYYINPGAVCGSGGKSTYAVIDITEAGILPGIITL